MSGLTLGLMSLSLVDLEVLAKSGTPRDKKHAAKILPVVKNQHLLLCTLLICNAAAMEALPIFLDGLISAWGAIMISVTLILLFGEIIPQSVCSRYGLAIGATLAPVVRFLVWICFPVAYPISKAMGIELCFAVPELKTLVGFHGNEAGKGGELTHDETTIIAGALELSEKTASDAMTPIAETFSIDINAKLDRFLINLILEKGHSRVPVYYEQPTNIIGLVLVKNLLTINPDYEVPVKSVAIRRIPRVQETMPLYDILNEFQKGHSHMAVVIKLCNKMVDPAASSGSLESNGNVDNTAKDVKIDIDGGKPFSEKSKKTKKPMNRWKINGDLLPTLPEEAEAVGIITMEDVIEELLQEEIFDETDHHVEDS
ncbi:protein of unknown function-containing protein [Forsythia ovata]|uniref:CNNM transmembrane domain-containing protein n=1 Tax=Forsythia ovata TaxID=205694 RepID=A0ABD1VIR6_9LAMI